MILFVYIDSIILCILFSAFFSASEMSYSSVSRVRIEHASDEGNRRSRTALYILDHFDDALSAILVGNNLVNIAASSLGTLAVLATLGEGFAWVPTLIITIAVIIFGETIPKIAARKNASRFANRFAPVLRILMVVLKPVTFVVVKAVGLITKPLKGETADGSGEAARELRTIIDMAEDEEVIDEEASDLISAAIDFYAIPASQVMTARVDLLAIDIDDDPEEILKTVEHSPHSRIPVYEDSIDNVIGILSVNHFLKKQIDENITDIRPLLMEPCYVYRTMKLPACLKALREKRQHLGVVTDEYGGTLGVISMEDVLEELVGDIWDETDVIEEDVTQKETGAYELDGDMPISDFLDLMKWPEEKFDFESHTVGGWCIEKLGVFPEEGRTFSFEDAQITVLDVDERRVTRILAEKQK